MANIGGFGTIYQIVAHRTFPQGVTISQVADDADPLDVPSVAINEVGMGGNGDLLVWPKANAIILTLAVIPGSPDDDNLAALYDANRVGRGKTSAEDVITLTCIYPNGRTVTFTDGAIIEGPPAIGVSSAGRLKTMAYKFAFENKVSS